MKSLNLLIDLDNSMLGSMDIAFYLLEIFNWKDGSCQVINLQNNTPNKLEYILHLNIKSSALKAAYIYFDKLRKEPAILSIKVIGSQEISDIDIAV